MDQITIADVQDIFGWSYPKALDFARKHGNLSTKALPSGKWLIPYAAVLAEVERMEQRAAQARGQLAALCGCPA